MRAGHLSLIFGLVFVAHSYANETPRQQLSMDSDWKFSRAATANSEAGTFDDTGWRTVNVPHDWSIEGPFAETNKTGGAGGFLPSGIAWYRKHFSLPKPDSDRRVFIEFDGVMQNSDVWINGFHLGHRPFGYVSFSYELTGHLNFGGDNVLAVRADTSAQPASRWYSGGGIYRHVRLVVADPVHIAQNGVFVTTPQVSATQATVHVQTTVTNQSDSERTIFVRISLLDTGGKNAGQAATVSQSLAAGKSAQFDQDILVKNPRLWNLDKPALYRALVTVEDGLNGPLRKMTNSSGYTFMIGSTVFNTLDNEATTFGIREAKFTPDSGFVLNGKKVVLKGVCVHHDGGAFGAAVPLAIWEDRLKTLRTLGVNAIRTAHNPVAPEFLDLCDRMGFLVMDEFFDCWSVAKNPHDYHLFFKEWSKIDAADTIRRDRNHPSVILYSIGNEIHDTPKPDIAIPIARDLVEVCHENDPSRPVTQALFRPNVSGDYTNGLAASLDVVGTNYRDNELLAAQRNNPAWKVVGTEQRHDRQTWLWLRDSPSHAGQFLWTGVDYLGESRRWPLVAHASGLVDRTGEVKPMAFERLSWWSTAPMVRIVRRTAPNDAMPTDPGYGGPELHTQVQFADWTSRNPAPHDESVEAYSNCDEVELILNGRSLGAQKINPDASPRVWKVPFASGKLKAIAKNKGKIVATDELRTAGKTGKIILTTDCTKLSPTWDDVACVRVTIVDADGIPVPRADDLISFKISGPGIIAAVDNADNASHESFQASARHAFQGECVAFVKANVSHGKITLTATAPGLKSSSVSIKCSK